jgi:hypothetical protein
MQGLVQPYPDLLDGLINQIKIDFTCPNVAMPMARLVIVFGAFASSTRESAMTKFSIWLYENIGQNTHIVLRRFLVVTVLPWLSRTALDMYGFQFIGPMLKHLISAFEPGQLFEEKLSFFTKMLSHLSQALEAQTCVQFVESNAALLLTTMQSLLWRIPDEWQIQDMVKKCIQQLCNVMRVSNTGNVKHEFEIIGGTAPFLQFKQLPSIPKKTHQRCE